MNIWLDGLNLEKIRKQEDMSLPNVEEELQDTIANGRSENVKAVRLDTKERKRVCSTSSKPETPKDPNLTIVLPRVQDKQT